MAKYDFSGWVTKNDIQCSDGVTIRHNAFIGDDGKTVPMVWHHDYSSPSNTIGYMELENRSTGVYGYGYFNETEKGKDAKILVQHGDVDSLSIGAKGIKKIGQDVINGQIYEVSLVLKGANPGAKIEHVIHHSGYGEPDEETSVIYTGLSGLDLQHSDEGEIKMTYDELIDSLTDEQAIALAKLKEGGYEALDQHNLDVIDTLDDDQSEVLAEIVANIDEDGDVDPDEEVDEDVDVDEDIDEIAEEIAEDVEDAVVEAAEDGFAHGYQAAIDDIRHSMETEGDTTLKHNSFTHADVYGAKEQVNTIIHAAVAGNAQSLAAVLTANGVEGIDIQHGLENIDILFPNTTLNKGIQTYNPGALNVDKIMGMFSKLPTSRVKNIIADISEDEARARGYIKGNEKFDTIQELYYRETTPGTVIRRTRIDRDDILDIKDNGIDVVAYLKKVQYAKLQEEIVRAAFFGDGRPLMVDGQRNPDKISEMHVRPIVSDVDLYTIKAEADSWENLADRVITVMPAYQGSGKPSLFINPFDLAKLKTLKDRNGRYLYAPSMDSNTVPTDAAIAAHFLCSEVVEYRSMPIGTIVIGNLIDYAFGQSKNGEIATFDQFDIDFNQHKYLIECRLSGAIQTPKSFVVVKVTNPGTADVAALEFSSTGLKAKPMHTTNTDETEVPGPKYASKHAETVDAKQKPAPGGKDKG